MMLRRGNRNRRSFRSAANHGESSWAVSYVDMLTLLLCFFIIFFRSDSGNATQPKNEVVHAPIAAQAPQASARIQAIAENLDKVTDLDAEKEMKGGNLELQFQKISFFDSGSTRLTSAGHAAIEKMTLRLKPYIGQIKIVVQGHTDNRVLLKSKSGLSDNWELSVIRATSVLKLFKQEGFPSALLSAEGFAETRNLASETSSDLAAARRITLRIEDVTL